ncbi:butyrate kinase [Tepidibacillus infernus]|uniref:Probable butyrate kinase n=1 Tax=Tepidibacillus decaturensis TaxID=1413211 RepID=A0A135L0T8_9BACI|nr:MULTISPECIES: butyrate kinase [Tepidibacillus]KXG42594.1 butyrate kinase [Tepidibacillus decaturensis]GBF12592.1 butyrate kinase 2 [Tepidibacillus sp. HK-1]
MPKEYKILAINPGSTSTKFALYQGEKLLYKDTVRHTDQELLSYSNIASQLEYRLIILLESLKKHQISMDLLDAVVGRGGFLKPLASGTYLVNEIMLQDLLGSKYGEHASNLGALMAYHIAHPLGIPSFIVDPIVVDEMESVARLSGIPEIERKSHVHALNIKAVSRKVANQLGKPYDAFNFVIVHLGGGISVVAERQGKLIDVNNANNEGPYSPERAGGLPSYQLVKLCYSGTFTEREMLSRLTKEGGFYSYLGTKNAIEVEERMNNGDQQAKAILDGMIYQVAKEIGGMAAVLNGEVDGIILTGGLAFSDYIVEQISKKIRFIAPIYIIPGEEELESLAFGALRILSGEEEAKVYN